MNKISVTELENTDMNNVCILDIRKKEDYEKGSVKNAVHIINIPFDGLSADNPSIPQNMPVYIICYKGESSAEAAEMLRKNGIDAYSMEGGYREYLRNWLIKNITI